MSSRSNYTYQGPRKDLRGGSNVCDLEPTRKDHVIEQLRSREVGEQYRACSGCRLLLKTSLLKAQELPRTPLVRSSPRSYRIRFRNSSGTVPVEYRSAEKTLDACNAQVTANVCHLAYARSARNDQNRVCYGYECYPR
jgi:hypothetical protein